MNNEITEEVKNNTIKEAASFVIDIILVWNQRFPEFKITSEEIINKIKDDGRI